MAERKKRIYGMARGEQVYKGCSVVVICLGTVIDHVDIERANLNSFASYFRMFTGGNP